MAFVYILQCADGSYYVGSTHSLEKRIWEHNQGGGLGSAYTSRPGRRPVTLVWSFEYANVADAYALEKQVQGWSRAKREALIRGDYDALPALAKKDFGARAASGSEPKVVE